ncbi:hypothetical protein S245_024968, partial [Arachis hypogaea]
NERNNLAFARASQNEINPFDAMNFVNSGCCLLVETCLVPRSQFKIYEKLIFLLLLQWQLELEGLDIYFLSPMYIRYGGIELWVIKIRGSAFLWHQVCCMVAVLFMIGKGLESPN